MYVCSGYTYVHAVGHMQVYPDVDGPLLAMETAPLSSPLLAHMADELARILLPPPVAGIFPFLSPKSPPKRYVWSTTYHHSLLHYLCT